MHMPSCKRQPSAAGRCAQTNRLPNTLMAACNCDECIHAKLAPSHGLASALLIPTLITLHVGLKRTFLNCSAVSQHLPCFCASPFCSCLKAFVCPTCSCTNRRHAPKACAQHTKDLTGNQHILHSWHSCPTAPSNWGAS